MRAMETEDWLIEGRLKPGGIGLLKGAKDPQPSMDDLSREAIGVACSLASGVAADGSRCRRVGVAYLGPQHVVMDGVQAFAARHGLSAPASLGLFTQTVNLEVEAQALGRWFRQQCGSSLKLIVIDGLSRLFPSRSHLKVLSACDVLRNATGAAVLVVYDPRYFIDH